MEFTPYSALAGGALIGLSASLLLVLNGRIAGISGILGGLVTRDANDRAWRAAFLVGLVVGATALAVATGDTSISMAVSLPWLAVSGLMVGIGTRIGSGCTSGHGVCGIARVSRRSLVATATFLASGMLTVFLVRHVIAG